jgi:hypothetical protein
VSEPVVATLNLPPGVAAVPAADRYGHEPLVRLNGAQSDTVNCPGGTTTVVCTNDRGLRPGESVTLLFRVVAAEGSQGGRITGTVMAGTMINIRVSVRVDVRPPATVDAIVLTADSEWLGLLPGIWLHPTLEARVENTGTSSKPVTLTIDQPAQLIYSDHVLTCATGGGTRCTSTTALDPGETLTTVFELDPDPWPTRSGKSGKPKQVHVGATLGSASDSEIVQLHHWIWPHPPGILAPGGPPSVSGHSSTEATTSPPSSSESPEPSSESPSGTSSTEPEPPGSTTPDPSDDPTEPPSSTEPNRPQSSTPPLPPVSPERSEPTPTEAPPAGRGGLGGLLGWLLGGGR